jgi:hypothetical protein
MRNIFKQFGFVSKTSSKIHQLRFVSSKSVKSAINTAMKTNVLLDDVGIEISANLVELTMYFTKTHGGWNIVRIK